jgi:hypothetical protein
VAWDFFDYSATGNAWRDSGKHNGVSTDYEGTSSDFDFIADRISNAFIVYLGRGF